LYKDTPYKAHTDLGDVVVIPPKYVEALKSERKLDFSEVAKDVSLDLLKCDEKFVANYHRIFMATSPASILLDHHSI
jgi:hypothetical protein